MSPLAVTIIVMFVQVRTELKAACVAVLTQYRKYCSGRSQPGQLILPEALKLLPIYLLGLLKSNLLRLNTGRSGVLIPAVRILPLFFCYMARLAVKCVRPSFRQAY